MSPTIAHPSLASAALLAIAAPWRCLPALSPAPVPGTRNPESDRREPQEMSE